MRQYKIIGSGEGGGQEEKANLRKNVLKYVCIKLAPLMRHGGIFRSHFISYA